VTFEDAANAVCESAWTTGFAVLVVRVQMVQRDAGSTRSTGSWAFRN
jgi:hypothetical protein